MKKFVKASALYRTALSLLAVFVFLLPMGVHAAGKDAPLYDEAYLLSTADKESLKAQILKLADTYNMNFVLLTISDAMGKSAMEYADDFYMDQGFYGNDRKGGAIYLIDMDNREVRIETAHNMQYYLTDSRVDEVIDAGYDDLVDGQYGQCFQKMLERTEYFLKKGIPSDQYIYDSETGEIRRYHSITFLEAVIAAVAALCAGAGACACTAYAYRKKYSRYEYAWRNHTTLELAEKTDDLVRHFVTHRRIPKDPPPGSGGGGGSRTTVHHSSGGGSFGGGGRKF